MSEKQSNLSVVLQQFNYDQMQLMMAIFKATDYGHLYKEFLAKVEYIKSLNGNELIGSFSEETREKIKDKLTFFKDIDSFDSDWKDDIYSGILTELKHDAEFKEVLIFFKEKLPLIYKLVNEEKSGPHDLLFFY